MYFMLAYYVCYCIVVIFSKKGFELQHAKVWRKITVECCMAYARY